MTNRTDLALATCVALLFHPARSAAARQSLMEVGWGSAIAAAQEHRLGPALGHVALTHRLFDGLPRVVLPSGQMTPPLWAEATWAAHLERREAQRQALVSIVARLNEVGLVPLLLKGARSLWLGQPHWRAMRDLDVLVDGPKDAARAQEALRADGYSTSPDAAYDRDFHHEDNLYRHDLPGWLEIHRRGAALRGETLLPTRELFAEGIATDMGGATALVLPPAFDLLHTLIHHHLGHWEVYNGRLDLKGLLEFAAGFSALSMDQRSVLDARAARSSLLMGMIEFWQAAAGGTFGLTGTDPLTVPADAQKRWAVLSPPKNAASRLRAIFAEVGLAFDHRRLRRCEGGQTLFGRARLRIQIGRWAIAAWGDYYLRERWT